MPKNLELDDQLKELKRAIEAGSLVVRPVPPIRFQYHPVTHPNKERLFHFVKDMPGVDIRTDNTRDGMSKVTALYWEGQHIATMVETRWDTDGSGGAIQVEYRMIATKMRPPPTSIPGPGIRRLG